MNNFLFKNTFLSAVLVSGVVFSSLTMPFILSKSKPTTVKSPLFLGAKVQPIFDAQHKDAAIRYVGFSIVLSVGTGVITSELLRKWHFLRPATESLNQTTNTQMDLQTAALELSADYQVEEEAQDVSLAMFPFLSHEQYLIDQPIEAFSESSQLSEQSLELGSSQNLELYSEYQTCRIKLPHLEQRLFAILVNDQYYSLFKTQNTQEKALETTAKLFHKGREAVITQINRGYAIWILQPEARLDLVS